jgi:hypothetical protein
MKLPNGFLMIEDGVKTIYVRKEDGTLFKQVVGECDDIKEEDKVEWNLDPLVNFLDFPPHIQWIHPIVYKDDGSGGFYIQPVDTYRAVILNSEHTTIQKLKEEGKLQEYIDNFLDNFKWDDYLLKLKENKI